MSSNNSIFETVNHFEKCCPSCGIKLKLKVIIKGKNRHRRNVKSWICTECNYSEYESNEREKAILEGKFDNEL